MTDFLTTYDTLEREAHGSEIPDETEAAVLIERAAKLAGISPEQGRALLVDRLTMQGAG